MVMTLLSGKGHLVWRREPVERLEVVGVVIVTVVTRGPTQSSPLNGLGWAPEQRWDGATIWLRPNCNPPKNET